jgi:hypothetical protein
MNWKHGLRILAAGIFLLLPWAADAQQVNMYWNTGGCSQFSCWSPVSAANPLPVTASVSASITGFPGTTQTTGTPLSVTTTSGTTPGALPAGSVVVASNVGSTNGAYCKLGATASVNDQLIPPNSWFGFTVGSNTQITCITSTSTTTVNLVGGAGLPTGSGGGGGGGGSGGNVTIVGPLGQAVAGASVPVVLPAAQITALTPPTTVTANQGTAASINAGWPVIGAELSPDATGTFTNATQTTSVTQTNLDGYGTALVSISGTYGTATGVFELSDDAGTTWYPIQGSRIDSCTVELGYTTLTNTNRVWTLPISGGDSFRVRSTAVASGTVNVRISVSSAVPPSSTAICGSVTQGTSPWVDNVTTWANGTLGAMANYGISPGAVLVPGVNAFITNVPAVSQSGAPWAQNITQVLSSAVSATNGLPVTLSQNNTALGTPAAYGSTPTGNALSANVFVTNSLAAIKGSSPVVNGASNWNTIAASQTAQILSATSGGTSGTTGDYLSFCVLQPTTTAAGTMTIADNATTIFTFTTGTLSNLAPITIPIGAVSKTGGWKVTTGANETATCVGTFT